MAEGPLAGLRILECGDFVAAPYAASLLSHLGADVIKIEPPEGDSNRRRGPRGNGDGTGALHLYLDQAKRGIVLDLDSEEGKGRLASLARTADALITSGPRSRILSHGLTYEALGKENPELVVTSIT